MDLVAFSLFDTGIGRCGIAWGARGIVGVQLPEARVADTRARLQQRFPTAAEAVPPASIQRDIDAITALLRGEVADLDGIVLDMRGVPPFHQRVYELARTIPPATTLTYGEVAARIGSPGSARAVGQALGRNPFAIVVPCHRVVAAGGKMGGFSANGGVNTKLRMLALEGAAPITPEPPTHSFDVQRALTHLRRADPKLARLIDAVGPFRMEGKSTHSLFSALAEAIVHQQLSGKAAATIYGRVCALFPRQPAGPTARRIIRASDADLRGAGLSRAKTLALRDLAQRDLAGELPSFAEAQQLEDETLIERLTQVRGIGRWTVEMLLMFRLGRPDVLPVDDFGVRKGFALAFGMEDLPTRQALAEHGARWAPYRSVASWYLWRAVDLARQTEIG